MLYGLIYKLYTVIPTTIMNYEFRYIIIVYRDVNQKYLILEQFKIYIIR